MIWLAVIAAWAIAAAFIVAWIRAATENERRLEELRRQIGARR